MINIPVNVTITPEAPAQASARLAKLYLTAVQASVASIQPVVNDLASIMEVHASLAEIQIVEAKLAEIESVAASIANVNSVAGALTAVNAINAKLTELSAIYTNLEVLLNLNGNIAAVTAVNAALSNINSVAAALSDIQTVVTNLAAIQAAPQAAIDAIAAKVVAIEKAGIATDKATIATDKAAEAEAARDEAVISSSNLDNISQFDVNTYKLDSYGNEIFTFSGYISPTTGAYSANVSYKATDFILLDRGKINYTSESAGSAVTGLAFYDKNKTFISGLAASYSKSVLRTIPATAYYIRCSQTAAGTGLLNLIGYDLKALQTIISNLLTDVRTNSLKHPQINNITTETEVELTDSFIELGYINPTTGAFVYDYGYNTTLYLDCSKAKYVRVKQSGGSATGLAFYDKDKVFISGVTAPSSNNINVSVPVNAIYFRGSQTLAGAKGAYVTNYSQITIQSKIDSMSSDVDNSKEGILNVNSSEISETIYEGETFNIDGYIEPATGAVGTSAAHFRTDYINCFLKKSVNVRMDGSAATGLVFYDKNYNFISGVAAPKSSNSSIAVPETAHYLRACQAKSAGVYYLKITGFVRTTLEAKLLELSASTASKRATKIIATTGDFNYNSPAVIENEGFVISVPSANDDIHLYFNDISYMLDEKLNVSFRAESVDTKISIGTQTTFSGYKLKFQVFGNTLNIYLDLLASGFILAFTATLPFTITDGETYGISIAKDLNKTVFSITDGADTYTKTVNRNDSVMLNSISAANVALAWGKPYVSLNEGDVFIKNISLSSNYLPTAKLAIFGDSFCEGSTMITDGLNLMYSQLLATEIGLTDVAIIARGGLELDADFYTAFQKEYLWYLSKYVLIALGTNNTTYSSYRTVIDEVIAFVEAAGNIPVLVTITPVGNSGTGAKDTRSAFRIEANNWVRSSGYRYIDVCKAVTIEDETEWESGFVRADLIHPTVSGHEAIYNRIKIDVPELFDL